MRQVEDALARQTLYGGDVVTNLLEVAPPPATDEAALTAALAESLELAPASVDALRAPDEGVVARVPRHVAEQHGFVPIAVRDGAIVIALAEPLSPSSLEQVQTALSAPVLQEVAPIVRLRQALERAYGVPMDRRTRRLAAMLDGQSPDQAARPRSMIPDLPDDPMMPRIAETPPPAVATPSRPPPATTIRASKPGADALKWFVKSARGDGPASSRESSSKIAAQGGRRRRGPFTRADAERVFADPLSTDAVLGALLEFGQQFFAYVALFLVHEDLAEGWEASGPGAAGDRVRKMGVPLDLPSAFATARNTRAPVIGPRAADGMDAVIASDLERPAFGDALIAPVVVGKRVVALLYADDAGEAIDTGEVTDVMTLVTNGGAALARMILKKKKKPSTPAPKTPFTPPVPKVQRREPEERAERAGILAKALVSARKPPPANTGTPATGIEAVRAPSVKPASLAPIVAPAEPPKAEVPPHTPPPRKQTLTGMPIPNAASKSAPPPSAPDAPTGLALESASGEMAALRELDGETPAMNLPTRIDEVPEEPPTPVLQPRSQPRVFQPTGASAMPPPPHLAGRRALGPPIPREEPRAELSPSYERTSEPEMVEASEVSDEELEELLELADRSNVIDGGRPSERFEVYQPREPPRPLGRGSEHELPKVIVAIEPEVAALIVRVIKGGASGELAVAELKRLGVAALPAIMDRFPGPTRVDRTTPIDSIPKPSDAGPLLSLLVALGRLALRDVLARTGDPLPETRFWATWLLTEIVDPESAPPLVPRIVDDDLAVRRAAWTAVRTLLFEYPTTGDTFMEPLTGVILDPGGGLSLRIRSAQALGEIRDRRAVDGLIFGLDAREPEIVAACHEALCTITRHDPPSRGSTWPSWYAEQGARSRVEWLIDALLDEDEATRGLAASELKDLTKVFFGFYADLPKNEREDARRRYVQWWRDEGRKKFEGRV